MLKKNLPERQCMVFDLRYEQYTIKEISQKLGYGETTIKKDLRKIKRELAFLLRT
ncbi:MAG: sigma factor-like helix-turn-helix DNA-binding protein [Aureispira sp.]